uniref:SFRICE_035462 n=1 Tax=Spodoptera frugiperda TaxID=7108 RepID=A0A2H1WIC5_SPOFR
MHITPSLPRWSTSRKCASRFDSRIWQSTVELLSFFENFSVVARSLDLCALYGNRLTRYYIELIIHDAKEEYQLGNGKHQIVA